MAEHPGVSQPRPGLVGRFTRWLWHLAQGEVVKRVGGPARARVITLFALVLALNGADASTVGADRPAARVRAAHQQHRPRPAQLGLAAGRRGLHDPGRAAGRPHQAHAAARGQHRPLEPRLAVQRVRRQLLEPAADPAGAGRGGRHGRAGDRLAHRRLLRRRRARADLVLHPRRRGGRHGLRLHRQRLRGERDRLAGRLRGAGDPGLLPRPGAVADRPRAASRRSEPPRAGGRRSRPGGRPGRPRVRTRRSPRGAGAGADRPMPEHEAAREAARRAGAVPNPRLVLHEDPSQMGLGRSSATSSRSRRTG